MLNQSKQAFGLIPAEKVRLWWGAKASYNSYNYYIELLSRRTQTTGGTNVEQTSINSWVENVGLPALRKLVAAERLRDDEERIVTYRDATSRYFISAGPKGTHGYLYICAAPYNPN